MSDLSGQYLGRYLLTERLGEGGMATVYKADDMRLEREVAVKIIRSAAFPGEEIEAVLKRFEREAKSLAKLSHPNIVKVHDYGEHEGSPYIIMEYLPGGTLKKFIGQPMNWRDAIRLLLPVARGVTYAHQRGILHRDIKPANILITESGEPMLSDFGIAKIFEGEQTTTLTGSGMAIGTPEYMSPEQWTGTTSIQSDLYSLAIVLYEMVAGRKPYLADTPAGILIKQATEPLPGPRKFVADLPEELEAILLKALAKEPADRYQDLNAFIGALENLNTAVPAIPPPVEPKRVEETLRVSMPQPATSIATEVSPLQVEMETIPSFDKSEKLEKLSLETKISKIPSLPFSRKKIGLLLGGIMVLFALWLGSPLIGKWFAPVAVATTQSTATQIASTDSPSETTKPVAASETSALASASTVIVSATLPQSEITQTLEPVASASSFQYTPRPAVPVLNVVPQYTLPYQFPAHAKTISRVAFSADGSLFATGSADYSVKLWRVDNGKLVNTLIGHTYNISGIVFSPDGVLLVTSSLDNTIRLWNIATGNLITTLKNPGKGLTLDGITGIAVPADGSFLLSDSYTGIRFWDLSQMQVTKNLCDRSGDCPASESMAVSPDGKWVAIDTFDLATSKNSVQIYSVADSKVTQTLSLNNSGVGSLRYSPDGQFLAAGETNNSVVVWNTSNWRVLHTFAGHQNIVTGVVFSPNNLVLASTSLDKTIKLWRVSDGKLLRTLQGTSPVNSVAFSPNGSLLLAGFEDGTTELWDVSTIK